MAKEVSAKAIGNRIRLAREHLNYTQAKLSTEASITPAAISQIESGDRVPSTPVLRKIASVLKVSTDFLLGNTNETKLEDLVQDENVQKFYRGFKDLSSDDQKFIQQQMELLKLKSQK
jgi:transcriptional regulator with XRE-family HTH domain